MPLESATHIADLNTSNPVGSTDKVQTLDDHVRLIKSVLKTDLNLAGAVTASHTELNILDGATLSTAELNILDGVTLTASQINDAARKSVTNAFTTGQTISSASSHLRIFESDGSDPLDQGYFDIESSLVRILGFDDSTATFYSFLTGNVTNGAVTLAASVPLSSIALGSSAVAASDFARLSQAATFASTLAAGATTLASLGVTGAATVGTTLGVTGATTLSSTLAVTSTTTLTGAVTAATIASSTSTTLVAGQLHFIDGDATLPNLTAGQWIQVVNDGSSSRTISKNGSDTTYYTLTGATVSTSFTLAARGVLTARCNTAGTGVYVSGSGITAAS